MNINKCNRRSSPLTNLYPERDMLMANITKISKQNVPKTAPGKKSSSRATKFGKKICVIGSGHLNRIKKNLLLECF